MVPSEGVFWEGVSTFAHNLPLGISFLCLQIAFVGGGGEPHFCFKMYPG